MQIDFQELAQNLPGSCSKLGITVAKCREQSFCDVRTEIQVKGVFAMAVFFVNGKEVEVPKNQKLLRYLRDEFPTIAFRASTQRNPTQSTANVRTVDEAFVHGTSECLGGDALLPYMRTLATR